MAEFSRFALPDQAAGEHLAERLAALVRPGDVIGLTGQLGAGKTTLARAFIRARAGGVELGEIPSPTFSLVQIYELPDLDVWHVDLYRLERPEEVQELGLEDAAADVTLIEWPERLGALPADMLVLRLEAGANENGRTASFEGKGDWPQRLAGLGRAQAAKEFLASAGWSEARRSPLAGDASFRRYERLHLGDDRAVLMDAPPPQEDVRPFVAMARHLGDLGYSAPAVEAVDADQGFVLLEDLGDDLFSRLLAANEADETELYAAAVDLLVELQRQPLPELEPYDDAALWQEAGLVLDWYLPAVEATPSPAAASEYEALWHEVFALCHIAEPVLVLRDYHADNLLWLPQRTGLARVGLLDFQDALAGPPAYDLVSLLEDARRDVAVSLAEAMKERYLAATGFDPEAFGAAYAVLGAQRNAKIIGIFTRLYVRDGKAAYLDLIPHVWGLLQRDLEHPALAALQAWFARHLPAAKRCRPNIDGAAVTAP